MMHTHDQPAPADRGEPGGDLVILVIDEDAEGRRTMVRILQGAGFQVFAGATLAEAVDLTQRHRPALVLLDCVLLGGNCVDVAQQVKQDPALVGTFVVLVFGTKVGPPEQAELVTRCGADGYITRPGSTVEFLARLGTFLRFRAGQEALRESEERYRALFDRSQDFVYLTDCEGRFLDANQAGLDMLGYRREEIDTLTFQSLLTGDQLPQALQTTEEILTTGYQQRPAEYRLRRKHGGYIFVETTASLIYHECRPYAIQGIARDITERKRAEDALRESEERHRTVLQTAMDGFCRVDLQGRLLEVNDAYCRISGYRAKELLAMRVSDLEASETANDIAARIEAIKAQIENRFETRHRRKDGSLVDLEVSAQYRPTDGGECVVFLRDISGRKRAEEALRNSERRLREAQKIGHTGYLDWDIRTNEIIWSDETCRMYGFQPGTHVPTLESTVALVPGEDREYVDRELAKAVAGTSDSRDSDYDIEHRIVRPDGQVIYVHARGKVTRSADGTPLRMLGTVADITERKRIEEEKKRLQLQLAQAQKMECIGRLAGGVAHDFNNLLTVINGYAAFLSGKLTDHDPLRRYALEIGEAGARAASLTAQLLAFSRKRAVTPKAINLNAVIADAERMLQRLIGEDVELVSNLAPRLGNVMADPDQVHQVIMNLAVNARDAMPNGGRFEIATAEMELDEAAATHPDATPGRYVMVGFSDTGTGMTEEVQQRIFEPFFTTKESGQGTGLGLATVYGILRQNGGWIDVESKVGRGSTFHIYLPRIDAAVPGDAVEPPAENVPSCDRTVLVVEDQEAVRTLTRTILEAHGYHVLEASGGTEAQALAAEQAGEIDLLLTDVVMPGTDGVLLSRQLQNLFPKLRVLLMSGYAEEVIASRGSLADSLAYIQKPFGPNELAAKVREVLT